MCSKKKLLFSVVLIQCYSIDVQLLLPIQVMLVYYYFCQYRYNGVLQVMEGVNLNYCGEDDATRDASVARGKRGRRFILYFIHFFNHHLNQSTLTMRKMPCRSVSLSQSSLSSPPPSSSSLSSLVVVPILDDLMFRLSQSLVCSIQVER